MGSVLLHFDPGAANPLDLLERIVCAHEWVYDRSSENELTVTAAGSWCEFHLHFSWSDRPRSLQTICAFDTRVPDRKRPDMHEVLALINAQIWVGHFDLLHDDGFLMFRYVMLLPENVPVTNLQCEELLEVAIRECERFYPAFQFVLWGGRSPRQALDAALIETVGEA